MKLYGGGQGRVDGIDKDQSESVGYSIPGTQVSSEVIPIGSDVIFVNLYTSVLCILHGVNVCIIIAWYYNKRDDTLQKWVDGQIKDGRYEDLLSGVRITANTTLLVEVIVRAARSVLWTLNSRYAAGTFLGVWSPNLQLLITAIVLNVILNISIYARGGDQSQSGLRTFFTLFGMAFILLYVFFPTIILTFVYPTRMIVIFAFIIAYIFATSVFSASIVKLYKHNKASKQRSSSSNTTECCGACSCIGCGSWKSAKDTLKYFLLFVLLWVVIIYLHFIMLFILYLLLVGRASVVTTGPSVIISLFTPALISSIGALVLKKTNLIQEPEEDCEKGDEKGSEKEKSSEKELKARSDDTVSQMTNL